MRLRMALIGLLLAACGEPPPPDPHAYVDSLGLSPVPEIFRTDDSEVMYRSAWLVRDSAAWNTLWARINRRNFNRPPQPRVDFGREMLVVLAAGYGSSRDPEIEIAGYDEPGPRTRRVAFLFTENRNCPQAQDVNTSLVIGKIPADTRDVQFRWIHTAWC